MALTEPFEAAVVNAAHSDESVTPKRVKVSDDSPGSVAGNSLGMAVSAYLKRSETSSIGAWR